MEEGSEVSKGVKVEIITRKGKSVIGLVEDLGIKKQRDLMVRLKSGEIGRVQRIITDKIQSEIEPLIMMGENYKLEFKSEALWSLNYQEHDIKASKSYDLHTHRQKASKVIIAKSIAALLNSEGGNLIIGVKEKKNGESGFEITGINADLEKLKQQEKDSSKDGYRRMIIDDIIRPYFPSRVYNQISEYLSMKFEELQEKIVCNIKVKPSNSRIFLNLEGRKLFFIRTETETRNIQDEELVDYCMKRFLS